MKLPFTISRLLGLTALAAGLVAAPAFAGTVNVNATSGSASGSGASITKNNIPVTCNVTFSISGAIASFPIPPATQIAQVSTATFTPGSSLCNLVQAQNLPWAIRADSVPGTNKVNLTFVGVRLFTTLLGYCDGDVPGVYDGSSNTVTIPAFSLTGTSPAGTCTSPGFTLNVTPSGLLTSTP
ncbi:hypothetical protein [Solimonas flava]|uniref:hypothetical protein n=1 Tax=Solimonas flava TaxID=415849 RepID=UPI0004035ABF|nr:hypothetical protein [Solimonas flava]